MDTTLIIILSFGLLMSLLAYIGAILTFLPEKVLQRLLQPLVAFAAGALLGGAFFHMLPRALDSGAPQATVLLWVVIGFTTFFALDQLLEWHHCHRTPSQHVTPMGPMMLVADGVHNLIGGLSIGAIFMIDVRAGIAAWLAAALHEVPQEIGDFGALVHSGYSKKKALSLNFIAALTFPLGSLIAYFVSSAIDLAILVAIGAGNFLYIAGADLIPEIKRAEGLGTTAIRFLFFVIGISLLYIGHILQH